MPLLSFPRVSSPCLAQVSLLIANLAACNLASAQAEAPETKLKDVVVTVSRAQAKVQAMPLHTTIVTQEDIQKSPAQTLDQLLRSVPGLNFTGVPATQSDPTGHQTKMRGLGNAKVLVLLDGVPIHDPFYLTTQWFKVPLSNIERVEVVRGGNSSLWGNMAVAGVVNIVSKVPKDGSGEVAFTLGSHGSYNASLAKNFRASEALSFNLAIDQLDSQGYQTTPSDQLWRFPAKQPVTAKNTNVQFTTFFKPSRDLKGYVRLGYHIQDQDISYQFGSNRQASPDVAASLTRQWDDKSSLTGTAWAQYVNFEKYNGATCYWQTSGTRCPSVANVTQAQVNNQIVQYFTQYGSQRYHEQGASAIYSKDLQGPLKSVQWGVDYRHLSAQDSENFYNAPTSLAQVQNLNSQTFGKGEQTFKGLFAQARVVPTAPLELTVSARYDTWQNTDRVNTRTTASGLTTGGPQSDNDKSAINPSLAARYTLNDDVALRGATYKSFRAPGFNNTTRTFGSPNPTIANPDLGPENLTGRELGIDYSRGPLSVGATYFRYDIKNMIATYRVTSANAPSLVQTICGGAALTNCAGNANFYTNDQDGQSQGLELTARWAVQPGLSVDAAYTRTLTELTRKGYVSADPIGVQLAGTPKDTASVGVTWQAQSKLRTHVQGRYIGRTPIDTTSTPGTTYSQGGLTVFDASVSYGLRKDMSLTANVINLFDKSYSENAYTFNQPWNRTLSTPRTLNVGLKYSF